MKNRTSTTKISPSRSDCIKTAYLFIYKEAKALLSSIEDEAIREVLERESLALDEEGEILHEMISPLIYLSLSCSLIGEYSIHFGIEQGPDREEYHAITTSFIRLIYKVTMATENPVDIEDCVLTDWIVTECAALFYCTNTRSNQHTRKVLKYKEQLRLKSEPALIA